jgi:RimJ/RimL family protein N-acetyltransferase
MIRPTAAGDIPTIVEILWEVGSEGRWIGTEVPFDRQERTRRLRSMFDAGSNGGFVADEDGVVGGSISLIATPYGVVNVGMALLHGWRGRGLGTQLLAEGIAWSRASGAHKLALEVWPHNAVGLALYHRMGFVEEGLLRRHYRRRSGELWDAVVMGLLLE